MKADNLMSDVEKQTSLPLDALPPGMPDQLACSEASGPQLLAKSQFDLTCGHDTSSNLQHVAVQTASSLCSEDGGLTAFALAKEPVSTSPWTSAHPASLVSASTRTVSVSSAVHGIETTSTPELSASLPGVAVVDLGGSSNTVRGHLGLGAKSEDNRAVSIATTSPQPPEAAHVESASIIRSSQVVTSYPATRDPGFTPATVSQVASQSLVSTPSMSHGFDITVENVETQVVPSSVGVPSRLATRLAISLEQVAFTYQEDLKSDERMSGVCSTGPLSQTKRHSDDNLVTSALPSSETSTWRTRRAHSSTDSLPTKRTSSGSLSAIDAMAAGDIAATECRSCRCNSVGSGRSSPLVNPLSEGSARGFPAGISIATNADTHVMAAPEATNGMTLPHVPGEVNCSSALGQAVGNKGSMAAGCASYGSSTQRSGTMTEQVPAAHSFNGLGTSRTLPVYAGKAQQAFNDHPLASSGPQVS